MIRKLAIIFILGILLFLQPLSAQTWEPSKRLTWNSGGSFGPAIASDSANNIHLVWHDDTPGNNEIFYKKSTDGGTTWTTKRLTWNWTGSHGANLSIDSSDNIYVSWYNYTPGPADIYYMKSTNGGTTWTTKRLTWNPGDSVFPHMAIDSSDNIHIVWYDNSPGNAEIYYKMSTNGGTAWTTKRLTWSPESSASPTIAVDSSNRIHVVWHDDTPGKSEIYYKRSTDGGATWATKRLTWSAGHSYIPTIAIDSSNNIHVVFYDFTPGNYEIFYRKSTDGGLTWTGKRLTWNPGNSYYPDINADSSDNIHVSWFDSTPPGNYEIYYTGSTDGGATWNEKRLTWSTGYSSGTALTSDVNDNILVVWSDETPGNFEIFLKKGIQ
jgi:hypothetical protein